MNETRRRGIELSESIAREIAGEMGLEIVEFVFHDRGRHSQLRIDVDRPGASGVGIADCERFSRSLDARMEGIEGLDSGYELQVSSPGIDRPIRSDDDIRRNTGRTVRLEFRDDAGRTVEARGILAGTDDQGAIHLSGGTQELHIPRDHIVLMKQDVRVSGPRRRER